MCALMHQQCVLSGGLFWHCCMFLPSLPYDAYTAHYCSPFFKTGCKYSRLISTRHSYHCIKIIHHSDYKRFYFYRKVWYDRLNFCLLNRRVHSGLPCQTSFIQMSQKSKYVFSFSWHDRGCFLFANTWTHHKHRSFPQSFLITWLHNKQRLF